MMMNSGCFRGGKSINPQLQKRNNSISSQMLDAGYFVSIILDVNVEDLSAKSSALSAIWPPDTKLLSFSYKKTHCTSADQLVIPQFTLTG